ncbi:MAG: acyl-CoA thioesterase [Solirubrobacteraceae bacterium]
MAEPFNHQLRVRYSECDAQGVVFNANYLSYFDISMTELWRAAFGSYKAMMDRGYDLVVAEAQIHFQAPARFDEQLTLEVAITKLGNTSIVTAHRLWRGEESLAQGSLRHVFVLMERMGKAAIPAWARAALAPWAAPVGAG